MTTDTDTRHLQRAIELAALGGDRVSPNPHVGAVIVRDGKVIGEGFHREVGGPHAEVEAIRAAGEQDLSRSDHVRVARAVLPPRPHAALHRRDPRGRDRPRRGRVR